MYNYPSSIGYQNDAHEPSAVFGKKPKLEPFEITRIFSYRGCLSNVL